MLVSVIIPAFNATLSIKRTLDSIHAEELPGNLLVEVIVVDDGSHDKEELKIIVDEYKNTRLVSHITNRGMCASRNTGIDASKGDLVTILDADDEFVKDWPSVIKEIVSNKPNNIKLCYAACVNQSGTITADNPEFSGLLTLDDILNERNSGEYIPIFDGEYVRKNPYIDIGTRKSCGVISYINFSLDEPIWVFNKILRIYNDSVVGSVSHNWTSQDKALETSRCYMELFNKYGELYKKRAPNAYKRKRLKLAIYMKLAGIGNYLNMCNSGLSMSTLKQYIIILPLLMMPRSFVQKLLSYSKYFGLIRKYG
ncbi:MAG: glycosyltransferase family 2 protein [Gammaproteobacteria bacterium]|nr:glycosyltransferase family 2 protein [Gammaproteobacteria bacterium]